MFASCAFFATAFIGAILERFFETWSISCEAIAAIVAVLALPAAILGYFDNRKGQRLEHRAYVELRNPHIRIVSGQPIRFSCSPFNYGRTMAVAGNNQLQLQTLHPNWMPSSDDVLDRKLCRNYTQLFIPAGQSTSAVKATFSSTTP